MGASFRVAWSWWRRLDHRLFLRGLVMLPAMVPLAPILFLLYEGQELEGEVRRYGPFRLHRDVLLFRFGLRWRQPKYAVLLDDLPHVPFRYLDRRGRRDDTVIIVTRVPLAESDPAHLYRALLQSERGGQAMSNLFRQTGVTSDFEAYLSTLPPEIAEKKREAKERAETRRAPIGEARRMFEAEYPNAVRGALENPPEGQLPLSVAQYESRFLAVIAAVIVVSLPFLGVAVAVVVIRQWLRRLARRIRPLIVLHPACPDVLPPRAVLG